MTDLRDEWPSEMRRPEPEPPVEQQSTTTDQAAEIAAHVWCDGGMMGGFLRPHGCCLQCGEDWPCLVRRLDERLAMALANEETALRHVRDLEDLIRAHGDEGLIHQAALLYDTEAHDDG